MKYKLIILPKAEIELKNSFDWYENKKIGLGKLFIENVENRTNH